MAELINHLVRELELATVESAAGERSWGEFRRFLANFEALAELHDQNGIDIVELIKGKHICYHISNMFPDGDTKIATVLMIRVAKLARNRIFPRQLNLFTIMDWLDQVAFLFKVILSEDNQRKPMDDYILAEILKTLSTLLDICAVCLASNPSKADQRELYWTAFEKTCDIANYGSSEAFNLFDNMFAAKIVKQLAHLLKDSQFVAKMGQRQCGLLSTKLWTIVALRLRFTALRCVAYESETYVSETHLCYTEMRQIFGTYRDILDTTEHLPPNDGVLKSFMISLAKNSRQNSHEVYLAMFNCMLKARNYETDGIWPILDIHMRSGSLGERLECLKIATGLFGKETKDIDKFKAMLEHVDAISNKDCYQKPEDRRAILAGVIALLCSAVRQNDSTKDEIQARLIGLLKDAEVEYLDEFMIEPMTAAISGDLLDVAVARFRQIYQSGLGKEQHAAALQALFKLIATEGNENTSYKRKFVEIVAAGCEGSAPEGCNKAMFSVLNETRAFAKGDDELCLLPLARAVFESIYRMY